jgi:formyltetrahydrofolate hydrolase
VTTEEKVQAELNQTVNQLEQSLKEVRSIAIAEAWKILQLLISKIVRCLEDVAINWSGAEKKELAMSLISSLYDRLFLVIDIPMVPSFLEAYLHSYVKKILLLLVSSTIDATVTTFREIGFFVSHNQYKGTNQV